MRKLHLEVVKHRFIHHSPIFKGNTGLTNKFEKKKKNHIMRCELLGWDVRDISLVKTQKL